MFQKSVFQLRIGVMVVPKCLSTYATLVANLNVERPILGGKSHEVRHLQAGGNRARHHDYDA